ncbi:MAG: SulP family inorganic anion transporter [Candidatus Paceibacterota bacterium]|jgi:SulP family sulfate permease
MILENIKKNLKSGLTVSLISIPLSVSLAVASGATPVIGIITAIWAGLIAAIFGGSNFNIVGPTGALSGIVATYVLLHGLSGLPMLTFIAGIFILIAYVLKLERYLVLIPSSVIHGFTLGVAFIIGLGQMNFALGLQNIPQHENLFSNTLESIKHFSSISWITFAVFIIFLLGLILFRKITQKIPGAIALAPLGILLGYLSETHTIPFTLQTLGSKFGDISFQFFRMPHLEFSSFMLETAMVVALVAILETMLSAKIADGMTHTKHNGRKEMFGLGLANIFSGLVGGMPATAALARTSLNIKTGATSRYSAIISVLSVALISLLLLGYFKYIPLAVIAAILVFVAIQMVEKEHYEKLWSYQKSGFFVSLFVALVTIVKDPIVGILLGVSISLLIFVDRISHGHFNLKVNKFDEGLIHSVSDTKLNDIKEGDVLLYSFKGELCYINSRAHVERFETNTKKYKYIILRLRRVHFIDTDGVEALDEIIDIIEKGGQQAILTGINPSNLPLIEELSHKYKNLKQKGLIFKKSEDALRFLGVPIHGKN